MRARPRPCPKVGRQTILGDGDFEVFRPETFRLGPSTPCPTTGSKGNGRNLQSGDRDELYFQDGAQLLPGVRFDMAGANGAAEFPCVNVDTPFVYEFDKALDRLLYLLVDSDSLSRSGTRGRHRFVPSLFGAATTIEGSFIRNGMLQELPALWSGSDCNDCNGEQSHPPRIFAKPATFACW